MINDAFSRLHGATLEEALNGGRPVITVKQFLGKEEGTSYFTPQSFVEYAKSLRPSEVADLEQVLIFMQEGLRIGGKLKMQTDRGKRKYVFLEATRANSSTGAKLIIEAETRQLLQDYVNAKFVINFTLDELVEEAMNS
jgi:hypothetical protein